MYSPPPFPLGLAPNRSAPSARLLQTALKVTRYMAPEVALSDNYGPQTQAAVGRFNGNGIATIGAFGWSQLFRQAYGDEPVQDMSRTLYSGRVVNRRTRAMLSSLNMPLTLSQGSYSTAVEASAGTHAGGGVVDVSAALLTPVQRDATVWALRKAGFAAWLRTPSEGFAYHIHACAIGDDEMAPAAVAQVADYFNHLDGLRDHAPDPFPRTWPTWAIRYNR